MHVKGPGKSWKTTFNVVYAPLNVTNIGCGSHFNWQHLLYLVYKQLVLYVAIVTRMLAHHNMQRLSRSGPVAFPDGKNDTFVCHFATLFHLNLC